MSNRVIKAQDIKLTDSREKARARFIEIDFKAKSPDSREIDGDSIPVKEVEEKVKIAEKEAYDKGFLEGIREGINREKKELALTVESVAKLVRELKMLKEKLLESSEREIIDLAFLIAGKVIHTEVSTSKEVILTVLKDTIRNIQDKEGIKIRLNPADYNYITEAKPDFPGSFCNMKNISIEKDEEIGRGGAMIETRWGEVDARLDQQLNKIRESLPL